MDLFMPQALGVHFKDSLITFIRETPKSVQSAILTAMTST